MNILIETYDKDFEYLDKDIIQAFTNLYAFFDEVGNQFKLAEDGAEMWLYTVKKTNNRFNLLNLALNEKKDKLLGFSCSLIRYLPDYLGGKKLGHISHIYVFPDKSNFGIGRKLVENQEAWFLIKKVDFTETQSFVQNENALNFWNSMNYRSNFATLIKNI